MHAATATATAHTSVRSRPSFVRLPRVGGSFLTSAARAFGLAFCMRAQLEHLPPTMQREAALAWVHHSAQR